MKTTKEQKRHVETLLIFDYAPPSYTNEALANVLADFDTIEVLEGMLGELESKYQAEKKRADTAEANYRFMVERAAEQKLDGYRELAARAAKAEEERDKANARVSELTRIDPQNPDAFTLQKRATLSFREAAEGFKEQVRKLREGASIALSQISKGDDYEAVQALRKAMHATEPRE